MSTVDKVWKRYIRRGRFILWSVRCATKTIPPRAVTIVCPKATAQAHVNTHFVFLGIDLHWLQQIASRVLSAPLVATIGVVVVKFWDKKSSVFNFEYPIYWRPQDWRLVVNSEVVNPEYINYRYWRPYLVWFIFVHLRSGSWFGAQNKGCRS